ncbi:MAG: biopolymer transporter ExbD [Verrucomicrobiae bacterium]|nr:biopolymer transporter ExbD [Verrucomicrobiae bacterium]
MARARKDMFDGSKPKVDLSPMIDLVFLLLIFFMVASTMITYQKDKRITIPIASDAKVPELIDGRVIVNVYADGKIRDESGKVEYQLDQIEQMMAEARSRNPNTRLHLRADKAANHKAVKDVIEASARGGVTQIIFSTYVTEK